LKLFMYSAWTFFALLGLLLCLDFCSAWTLALFVLFALFGIICSAWIFEWC
ncbi:hypothetical protein EDC94DRAFT_614816, partial [Helicostylum pulchrum]